MLEEEVPRQLIAPRSLWDANIEVGGYGLNSH